jgi:hypothetical protein
VRAVLDLPVPADPAGEFLGSSFVRNEVGDRVDGLGAPAPLPAGSGVDRASAADDLDRLAHAELDPCGDEDDLEAADLPASVCGLGLAMPGLDLPPGQLSELATQAGLVALHGQHPVRTTAVQIADVGAGRTGG